MTQITLYLGSAGFALILLVAYIVLRAFGIPAGHFIDWVIGAASFWWLLAIVTLPWNVCFEAQEVIAEAKQSESKGIAVDFSQVKYARKVSRWALIIAIALHLISTGVLYLLARTGISPVGYVGSAAAFLFTALRPAARGYQYIAARLWAIRREVKYPREDVLELRDRVFQLEAATTRLDEFLDRKLPHSWAATMQQENDALRQNLSNLRALLEQLKANNELEHQKLAREARNAVAQLSEDSQVLGHVREIIQFFKQA